MEKFSKFLMGIPSKKKPIVFPMTLTIRKRNGFTIKPVLVATSIQQATCIKQARKQFPEQANVLKCTCIKQAPALNKQIWIVP